MDINWPHHVFSTVFFKRVEWLCQKSFGEGVTAEEAATYVIEKLSENNWERCHSFRQDSNPDTFLYSIATRLVIDYQRKIEGRVRPPAWLTKEGDLWVNIWRELCLNRQHPERIILSFTSNNFREPSILKQIISAIKVRLPWCGVSTRPVEVDDQDSNSDDLLFGSTSIDDQLENANIEHGIAMAHMLLEGALPSRETFQKAELVNKIKMIVDMVELTEEDRLILKMRFCDGLSYSAIANRLGVAKHKPDRQIKNKIGKFKELMAEHNLHMDFAFS